MARSIGLGLSQSHDSRLQDNPQVEQRAPIVDVPKIVLDAALHLFDLTSLTSVTVDLRPPRQARFDMMPKSIIGYHCFIFGVMRRGVRARTDEGHITPDDVEQLRQLVDAGFP